jgi:NAD(P)-dependent dehydrogenase (short-subunit alcohol dehydrogenase family)
MVCNAGIMDGFDLIGNVTDETWRRVFSINVDGPMMQIRNAVNHFLENGGGNIVVTCSAASLGGGRAGVAYTASKHALLGLMRNTAFCYAKQGIRCNALAPGGVQTNIQESMKSLDPEGAKLIQAGIGLMPRIGEPQELANVALFLASDEASLVNGVVLPVDAGWDAY